MGVEEFPSVCHRCGAVLERGTGSFYVVRIEAYADPSPPRDDDPATGVTIEDLLVQMSTMSEQELMDQVYQHFTLLLCRTCFTDWSERGCA